MPEGPGMELLQSTRALESFEETWRLLWDEDGGATPFQSPAWLIPWWHQFGTMDLRAVVLERQGRPLGLLPFYVYREPTTGERQLLLLGAGTTDYLDGVFGKDCRVEDVEAGLRQLLQMDGWDALYAGQLRASSLLAQALRRGAGTTAFATESCARMPAVGIEGLPGKIRQTARYYGNRARRAGDLRFEVERDRSGAEGQGWRTAFDDLVRLHTERWEERGEAGIFADPRVVACHREAIPRLLESGLGWVASLRLSGDPMAVCYVLVDAEGRAERTAYLYLVAHATRYAELRPGTLAMARLLGYATEQAIATLDVLRGEESYKRHWHVTRVPTCGVTVRRERKVIAA
ncbi:GNAT family N-acetyltransferase [Acidobacteria bacterium AB60]|nr:GNAT family N-acetyltransferase [Acidobacteria bacterium AB60]